MYLQSTQAVTQTVLQMNSHRRLRTVGISFAQRIENLKMLLYRAAVPRIRIHNPPETANQFDLIMHPLQYLDQATAP